MKKLAISLLFVLAAYGFADNVTVSAKGDDVRSVIHSLFSQTGKNYVLEPGVRFVLYLSLKDVDFDEALALICKQADLTFEVQNGIYFVNRAKPEVKPKVMPKPEKPKGTLPETVLKKLVTTKLEKKDLKSVLTELTLQTGVPLEIAPGVANFKLDAFLNRTSLKFALDSITKAAGLVYKFTNNLTIQIVKPEDPNRVVIHTDGSGS